MSTVILLIPALHCAQQRQPADREFIGHIMKCIAIGIPILPRDRSRARAILLGLDLWQPIWGDWPDRL